MGTDSKVELYRSMRNLVQVIKRRSICEMKEKFGNEISHAEFRVLLYIDPTQGSSMGDIAARWSMHMSNLAKTVSSLITRGYIYKRQSEDDKRVKLLFLTETGSVTKEKFIREFEGRINVILESVDDNHVDAALNAVNSILEQIRGK